MAGNILNKEVFDYISVNRIGVLSTFSWDSPYPDSALVYYLLDNNADIITLTLKESRKIKNIQKNNRVAILIGGEVEPIEVQLKGLAEIIDDQKEVTKYFEPYLQTANNNPNSLSFPPLTMLNNKKGLAAVKIKITSYKYSDFRGRKPVIIAEDI